MTLSGTGTDPDGCPVTLTWSGACGTATGASPTLTGPIGVNTEMLTVNNGGATKGLPTSSVQITVSDFSVSATSATATVSAGQEEMQERAKFGVLDLPRGSQEDDSQIP